MTVNNTNIFVPTALIIHENYLIMCAGTKRKFLVYYYAIFFYASPDASA